MDYSLIFMATGFVLASYSIIANDAIQTLGTFISSNAQRRWWVLWLYTGSVLTAVVVYGFMMHAGDVTYGRLEKIPIPQSLSLIYVLPALIVLVLTRFSIPVSTTFIILSIFAPTVLTAMLAKSLIGYLLAFVVGLIISNYVTHNLEKWFITTRHTPRCPRPLWIILQWLSTAFLWSQWLIQDLANIFVYMPNRQLSLTQMLLGLGILLLMLGYVFYAKGGSIQRIVTSKTNTGDIRSATIIDFTYGMILLVFKEYSTIPMSTTWVFIGLLAGREYALTLLLRHQKQIMTIKIIMSDIAKATLGLLVSVLFALLFPYLLSLQ